MGETRGGSGFWAVGAGAGSGSRRAGDPVSNQEAADQGGSNMEGKIGSSPPAVQGRECVRWRPASRRAQTEEACFRSARAACRALVQEVSECWLFTARRDGDGGCVGLCEPHRRAEGGDEGERKGDGSEGEKEF